MQIYLLSSCRHFSFDSYVIFWTKYGLSELIIFKVIHICICHMSIIGNGNTHKALIGCLSRPIDVQCPRNSVGNVIWAPRDRSLEPCVLHYVSKLLLYSICNYVASICIQRYSICIPGIIIS